MKAIQFILLTILLIAATLSLLRLKRRLWLKPFIVLLSAFGAYCILFPEVTSQMARSVGVGRGADLLSYVFMTLTSFVLVHFYGQLRILRAQLTLLLREKAIREAEKLGKQTE